MLNISPKEFGERIKFYRAVNNMSQRELAKKIGMAQSNLVRIEAGEAKRLESLVYRFSQAFNISPDELVSDESIPEAFRKVHNVPNPDEHPDQVVDDRRESGQPTGDYVLVDNDGYTNSDFGISMIPTGSILHGQPVAAGEKIEDGKLYILEMAGLHVVRRIIIGPNDGEMVAVSDIPDMFRPIWRPENLIVARLTSYTAFVS